MNKTADLRIHGALILVSLIYGYFYVAMKLLLIDISTSQLILLRFVLTAIIAFALERTLIRTRFESTADFWKVAGLGLAGVFLVQILVAWGLSLTTAFHAALIMATIPVSTTLFSMLLGRETFHLQKLLGIFIAFAGVAVLLFFSRHGDTPLPPLYVLGDFLILLNSLTFSWFLIGTHSMLKKYHAFSFMAYCYVASAIVFGLGFIGWSLTSSGVSGLEFLSGLSTHSWLLVAYVVLFASLGTYTLNNYALSQVSPSIVAVYIFIQPIISAISGHFILHEPFNLVMAISALITFAGVMITTRANQKGIYLRASSESLKTDEATL